VLLERGRKQQQLLEGWFHCRRHNDRHRARASSASKIYPDRSGNENAEAYRDSDLPTVSRT